jgi:hypothetical protein
MNTYKYSKLFLISLLAGNFCRCNAAVEGLDIAKTVMALFGSGAAKYTAKKMSEVETVKSIAEVVNISPLDAGKVLALSGGLYAISIMAKDDISSTLKQLAFRAPIAAVVIAGTQTKAFQAIASNVPVIGDCITCEEKDCKGVCEKCKLTKTVITIGVWKAMDSTLTHVGNKGFFATIKELFSN